MMAADPVPSPCWTAECNTVCLPALGLHVHRPTAPRAPGGETPVQRGPCQVSCARSSLGLGLGFEPDSGTPLSRASEPQPSCPVVL